jgi:hypothetical protein
MPAHDSTRRPVRPADDPWWRFTPRNPAVGYLSLFAAVFILGWSLYSLLAGDLSTARTVFFIGIGVVAVLWLVRAVTGLKALRRRRTER